MRGIPVKKYFLEASAALIMQELHQQYSEIKKMTLEEIMFFCELITQKNKLIEQEQKNNKGRLGENEIVCRGILGATEIHD